MRRTLFGRTRKWLTDQRTLRTLPTSSRHLTTSQIVKYADGVHVVTRKHLKQAIEAYPDAANETKAWTAIVEVIRWHNFDEVRRTFKDADSVEGYVIFNIR